MKNNVKGFTLIELVIVLVIIGIIAAFALPQYRDYIARTQVAEAIQLSQENKLDISENLRADGVCHEGEAGTEQAVKTATYSKIFLAGTAIADPREDQEVKDDIVYDTGCTVKAKFGQGTAGEKVAQELKGKELTLSFLSNGSLAYDESKNNEENKKIANKFIAKALISLGEQIKEGKIPDHSGEEKEESSTQ